MKILWIVNTIFPYPASQLGISKNVFGGWLAGLFDGIKNNKNLELAIATVYNGKKVIKMKDDKSIYYLIPKCPNTRYTKNMLKYWQEIASEFQPELVEIHGTEFPYGLAFLEACPNVPSIVVIQGLVEKIANVYYANINMWQIIKNITIRDIMKFDTIFDAKRKFKKRGINERKVIERANAVIGRTQWDYANCIAINPNICYYKGNEILRSSFYNEKWDPLKIEKNTIFCSQGTYPIKGLHYVIEAISIVKERYPNVKLYIAGFDIINKTWFKMDGYAHYIRQLIKKYGVQRNIIFTGVLDEKQMLERMVKSHVFVLPSAIENSSNSLGEAMIIGMPCIATNTGGTMDMLENKKEGLLYSYTDPEVLAEYISFLFENEVMCKTYGENAREKATELFNKEKNIETILKIYEEVRGKNNE